MPGVTLDIKHKGSLHNRILEAVRDRVLASRREMDKNSKWKAAEERTLAYLPEREADRTKRLVREGGKPQYTTIQLPYSYALLMSAHTYWTSVFLSRNPVIQYSARHGEPQMQVQAVEALIDYQMQVGQMLVPLYIWLYDVGKYGVGIIGTHWDEEISVVSEILEEEELIFGRIPTGRTKKIKRSKRIKGYVGNKIYNVQPQNFFPDPRVPMHNFQKGEFCAVYSEISWNEVLRRENLGLYTNVDVLREKQTSRGTVGVGGPGNTLDGGADSSPQLGIPDVTAFSPNEKNTTGTIKAYECYINLVPQDWKLGKGTFPEKWVFTVTTDWTVVLGAQPLGAYHNKFPFNLIEMEPEGYGLINRGIPEVMEPIQNSLDWLINTHFYNVRKTLNNQIVVDPSRVVMSDVLDPEAGGVWRLKPRAYGEDPRTVYSQVQITDVTQNHLRDATFLTQLGEIISGINQQVQGQSPSGGRRSATEVRTSSGFSINRLKATSEFMSAMGWTPMASMFIQNSQQYYEAEEKFRLVGDLATNAGQQFIDVNPDAIQGFYDLVPVDGTLPVDRFAQANLWRELLGQMRNFPELMQQYDIGKIFEWVAQLTGLKNISQFKTQIVPDAQLQAQAQAGNVIPLGGLGAGGTGGGSLPDVDRVQGQGQTGLVGPAG